jgi:hypothetical protein
MPGFKITWRTGAHHPAVYPYATAVEALRKARSLMRAHAEFEIADAETERAMSLEELERIAERS